MEPLLAAKYPFLRGAAAVVEEAGASLEDLVAASAFAPLRRRARDRVVAAVKEGELPKVALVGGVSRPEYVAEMQEETLAYALARVLVSATKDAYVVRRHALAEAVRAKRFLDEDSIENVALVARELGIDAEEADDGERAVLHFTEYLKFATHLKDVTWKLANQPLARGVIAIEKERLARLAQESLRRRIESELPKPVDDAIVKALSAELAPVAEAARERKEAFEAQAFGDTDLALMPPCMQHILAMLQRGENAPHTARFAITSFLHAIGMDSDGIMKLFAAAPDFREDLTRYQVEHITGKSSGTEYSPPGCQAMKTFGICYNEDNWCRSTRSGGERIVGHPLTYYRWMGRRKQRGLGTVPPHEPRQYDERREGPPGSSAR